MSIVEDFKNAFRKRNNGLIQIIIINAVVFIVMGLFNVITDRTGNQAIYEIVQRQLGLPARISEFLVKPWTLLTYSFIHAGFWHVLSNMLFFYQFGRLIDEYLGNRRLMNIYFMGIVLAGIVYLIFTNTIPFFQVHSLFLVGASAGVFSVMMAAATLMPDYTFFLFLIGPVRIKYIVAVLFTVVLIQNALNHEDLEIVVHITGLLFGYLYIVQLRKGHDLATPFQNIGRTLRNMFKRKPKMRVTYRSYDNGDGSYPSEDEVDRILDKINRSGYESLTKEEKQKLFHASQKN
jgi:membrane associated rhomboid family serine protease